MKRWQYRKGALSTTSSPLEWGMGIWWQRLSLPLEDCTWGSKASMLKTQSGHVGAL